jgi:peptidoglycan L-alanyl-D-glutamate endopeptidase CwlK
MAVATRTTGPVDKLSLERIQLLHPKLRLEATQILSEIHCKTSTPNSFCRFAFTLRTIAEQDAIYAQGRTKPGKIVSNAPGGKSFHNYGLAIDIAFVINNTTASWSTTADWDKDQKADWMEVVDIFKKYGWEWGDRGYVDLPHFQKVFGTTPSQLYARIQAGKVDKDGYVIL